MEATAVQKAKLYAETVVLRSQIPEPKEDDPEVPAEELEAEAPAEAEAEDVVEPEQIDLEGMGPEEEDGDDGESEEQDVPDLKRCALTCVRQPVQTFS